MNPLIRFIQKHRRPALLLAAELLFLSLMFYRDSSHASPRTLTPGNELVAYSEGVLVDEDGCRLAEPSLAPTTFATTVWLPMERSSYQVVVYYRAEGLGGQCYFINEELDSRIIQLDPYDTQAVFSVNVPIYTEDAQIHFDVCPVDENGNTVPSNLTITGVSIRPTGALRRVDLLNGILFFLLLDLLLLAFHRRSAFSPATCRTFILLAVIILAASLPLTVDYLPFGHDLGFHLSRIQGLADGLTHGQFPVRIAPTLLHGSGYAENIFYCDLFLYPFALMRIWGYTLQACYKAYVVTVNAATALITWHCLRRMLGAGREHLALAGSALYTLSLYRLCNLYLRAALGEYTAMVFFPLIAYGLWRLLADPARTVGKKVPIKEWLPFSLGFSGVICCHVLSCEIALLFTAAVCLIFLRRVLQKHSLAAFCKAAACSLLSCLWFLLPFADFYLNGEVQINTPSESSAYAILRQACYPAQMVMPFVSGGGLSQPLADGMAGEMPQSMGLMPLVVLVLVLFCAFGSGARAHRLYPAALFTTMLALAASLLASNLFPWFTLASMSRIILVLGGALQYVWRFLGIATLLFILGGCFAMGVLADGAPDERKAGRCGACLMLGATFISAFFLFFQILDTAVPARYYDLKDLNDSPTQIGLGEYLPAQSWLSVAWDAPETQASENLMLEDVEHTARGLSFSCTADENGTVDTPLFYYLHYQAEASDGTLLEILPNETGRLRVLVPSGFSGRVWVQFKVPLFWRAAEAVSLVFVLGLAGVFLSRRRARRKEKALL